MAHMETTETVTRRHRWVFAVVMLIALVGVGSALAGSSAKWPTASQEIASTGVENGISFCGTKPITLGIEDGFGINSWSQESYAAVRSEASKCKNVKQIVLAGGGQLPQMISDVNSLVAQGANAITIIPDYGQAELAAIQKATQAGVKVVPWGADPGGTAGKDYVTYVDWNDPVAGTMWANWMVQALHGKGNVIFLGGPAGSPVGEGQLKAIVAVFAKHPGMKLLTGNSSYPVTNWDPATAQKVTAALLAKYPKIDGIISNFGTDALAAIRAFDAANRKLVPVAALDANGLSCLYQSTRKSAPQFQIATISNRNWLGRIAARKAIAAAEGLANNEPSRYTLPFYENTLASQTVHCNPKAGQDFYVSDNITPAQVSQYGKVG
jgi:ribose transport system substrate-binding protein